MNINNLIEKHKKGVITFLDIGAPQHVCANDDECIEYINYCWSFLGATVVFDVAKICFYDKDSNLQLELIQKEVMRAHGIIEKCHKFLRKDAGYLAKWFPDVYTGKLAQGKR